MIFTCLNYTPINKTDCIDLTSQKDGREGEGDRERETDHKQVKRENEKALERTSEQQNQQVGDFPKIGA